MTKAIDLAKECGIKYFNTPPGTTEMHCTDRQLEDFYKKATKYLDGEFNKLLALQGWLINRDPNGFVLVSDVQAFID